jgi:hypothetical protein
VALLVKTGRDLTIPRYQPTNPNLENSEVPAFEEKEEVKREEGESSLYSLVLLKKFEKSK